MKFLKTKRSARTWNRYRTAVHGLFAWMGKYKKLAINPAKDIPHKNEQADRKRIRRELNDIEIVRLLRATEAAGVRGNMTGEDRALLYRTALGTGFRLGELGRLSIKSCRLGGQSPYIIIEASESKAGRRDEQPVDPELAGLLKSRIAGQPPETPLFKFDRTNVTKVLCRDLKDAGIDYLTADAYAVFHAFRHTFATRLGLAGISLADLMRLIRVTSVRVAARYLHPQSDGVLRQAIPTYGAGAA